MNRKLLLILPAGMFFAVIVSLMPNAIAENVTPTPCAPYSILIYPYNRTPCPSASPSIGFPTSMPVAPFPLMINVNLSNGSPNVIPPIMFASSTPSQIGANVSYETRNYSLNKPVRSYTDTVTISTIQASPPYMPNVQVVPGSEVRLIARLPTPTISPEPTPQSPESPPLPPADEIEPIQPTAEPISPQEVSEGNAEINNEGGKVKLSKIGDVTLIEEGGIVAETTRELFLVNGDLKVEAGSEKRKLILPSLALAPIKAQLGAITKFELEVEGGRPIYQISSERRTRLFGLLEVNMPLKTFVNAETRRVESIEKPWWAFLAMG
ncbi:MAG: hypothetical protein AABX01_01725 [Candidatus Micrarchaeota archaeon]